MGDTAPAPQPSGDDTARKLKALVVKVKLSRTAHAVAVGVMVLLGERVWL